MNIDVALDARRAWVVTQPAYIDALERLDRAGERYSDNHSPRNRGAFYLAADALAATERMLNDAYDARSQRGGE
jgi:hypothetical protein